MLESCWSTMFILLALLGGISQLCLAATVEYNWHVTWVTASPDGFTRPVIGINGRWPCPTINVNIGDRVVVRLTNDLGNETTGIHWHGILQRGTIVMDGPGGVTQCPIPPGGTITYDFMINQPGTHWYHSHEKGQYVDGFRGPIIVNDPGSPYKDKFDEELVLTVSDWYHKQMPDLLNFYLSKENTAGAEPIPNSTLINDAQNFKFNLRAGRTYLVRVINMSAFAAHIVHFDDHQMTIVEIDGIYTEKKDTDFIYLSAGQRYSVLIEAQKTARKNYAFLSSMDQAMFDTPAPNPNVTGFLVYDNNKPLPSGPLIISKFKPADDFKLVPNDRQRKLRNPDVTITLNAEFREVDGVQRAFFNNVTYVGQKVPSLYTALSVGHDALDPRVYGVNSNPFVLKYNDVVDVVLNNIDPGGHPFHMHGHAFQVLQRSERNAGPFDPSQRSNYPAIPMRRDTVKVEANGHIVIRFKADNPGVYLFHCHIEWHVEAGLTVTFIEAPDKLQGVVEIPQDQLKLCQGLHIPTEGNAAGNTMNHFDLTGANTDPPAEEHGAIFPPPPSG